jgi:hypothetical protein
MSLNNIKVKGEPKEVTEIRNKILDEFKDLTFIEEGHKYFLKGVQLPSVSEVTHKFCAYPFDSEAQAIKYAETHGETPQYWMDKWKFNNLKATTSGTLVHSYGESLGWMLNGHPEFITEENKCKYIKDKNWLIPTRPKEEAVLKFWEDTYKNENTYFVLAETKVYTGKNKQLTNLKQDYAGTFDLLWYYKHPNDDSKSGLVILDYKTNGSLTNSYNRDFGRYFLEPFGDLYEESLSSYKLQLSAYQLPLEDIGLKVIGRRIIWLKDDGTYELIPIEDYTERLREVL